ncbi:hypothetical protein J1605_009145 [Eschrichtius robustus]|uniref:Uncharacterized protein n=1 Tax=Eschrichtius robustus TaxID=9764 RepID=A0AB34GXR6_ESCRO|nr:hypothetical protein J1605_009145 [Eschrichtius robustus]
MGLGAQGWLVTSRTSGKARWGLATRGLSGKDSAAGREEELHDPAPPTPGWRPVPSTQPAVTSVENAIPSCPWSGGSLCYKWPVGLTPGGCNSFAEVTPVDLATKCRLAAPSSSGGRAGSCLVPTWPCVAALAGLALAPLSLAGRRAAVIHQDKPLPLAFVLRGPSTAFRLPDQPSRGALGQAWLTPQGTALLPMTVLLQVDATQDPSATHRAGGGRGDPSWMPHTSLALC